MLPLDVLTARRRLCSRLPFTGGADWTLATDGRCVSALRFKELTPDFTAPFGFAG